MQPSIQCDNSQHYASARHKQLEPCPHGAQGGAVGDCVRAREIRRMSRQGSDTARKLRMRHACLSNFVTRLIWVPVPTPRDDN